MEVWDMLKSNPKPNMESKKVRKEPVCKEHKSYLAGAAITHGKCLNCKVGYSHGNTFTPKYCWECADELKICRYCGVKL